MADLTGLEGMFRCPQAVRDSELEALYERLRLRLVLELANVSVTTVQIMRASEVLGAFLRLKQAERLPFGDEGGFPTPTSEREYRAFAHTLMKDWDATVVAARPSGGEALAKRDEKWKQLIVAAIAATEGLPPAMRNELTERVVRGAVSSGLEPEYRGVS